MRTLILTTLLILSGTASAGLYKWVDNDGNVHYSQKPPRDQQYKQLKAPASAPTDSQPSYQTKTDKSVDSAKGNTAAAESAKNQKIRAENCEKAKKALNNYQIHRRVRDKDGNVTIIDNNERAKQIENAKQAITNYCD